MHQRGFTLIELLVTMVVAVIRRVRAGSTAVHPDTSAASSNTGPNRIGEGMVATLRNSSEAPKVKRNAPAYQAPVHCRHIPHGPMKGRAALRACSSVQKSRHSIAEIVPSSWNICATPLMSAAVALLTTKVKIRSRPLLVWT